MLMGITKFNFLLDYPGTPLVTSYKVKRGLARVGTYRIIIYGVINLLICGVKLGRIWDKACENKKFEEVLIDTLPHLTGLL